MTTVYEAYAAILGDDLACSITATKITEIPCTDECKARQAQWEKEIAAYTAKWPHYCRTCNGAGGHWYEYDPSPAGVSLAPGTMTDYDPCPDCIEHGKCPRCANEVWTEEDWDDGGPVTCPECGWKEDEPEIYAAPERPECFCWEEHLP